MQIKHSVVRKPPFKRRWIEFSFIKKSSYFARVLTFLVFSQIYINGKGSCSIACQVIGTSAGSSNESIYSLLAYWFVLKKQG